MNTEQQYLSYKKPSWAPPAKLFGPVWTVLYLLIAISFGYVGYLFFSGVVSAFIVLPFVLNLASNFAFTYLQFKLRNFLLASVDIIFVWLTLLWAMLSIYPIAAWIAAVNLPYLVWVSIATVLQLTVTVMNWKTKENIFPAS
jgi:translocator protein